MKFDLHCHIKGGSIDSKVSLERYIELLRGHNFQGMMITDHDTYRACKYWDRIKDSPEFKGFTVIKGVEYDTKDAGHFLVVMPDGVTLPVLTIRGMKLDRLIRIVHHYGGLLGPAHPYGVRSSSAMLFKCLAQTPHLIREFDFIETFNTCESPLSNVLAHKMAGKYGKIGLGGTDSHVEEYVGMGYTEIDAAIHSNNDMIRAIKERRIVDAGGIEREETVKSRMKESRWGVLGFHIYNKGLGKILSPYRGLKMKRMKAVSHYGHE
ncbi:MAG: PHP-associated domain-containing protein [Eubacteriaceae bacterium]|nr:PHP-associated domain-containing protein [Eubacteriaceae bacterium]